MCGICGGFGAGDDFPIEDMTSAITHRGPDDYGYYVDENVALGNRRLSIIDLAGGHQPVHNEDESIWVTYNGEIYNYRELRMDLQDAGHRFYTDSDTETIVHAYEEWGTDCLSQFKGMFAFAIWDVDRERLFLARDRFGKKPLYYTEYDGRLLFGSEIKCLLETNLPRKINEEAMNAYFAYRYVPGPATMFDGVYKLQPGHYMLAEKGTTTIERYWNFDLKPTYTGTIGDAAAELRDRLETTMEQWIRADVPVGAYLSGGVDSSSVVALLSEVSDEPIRTFTVAFGEERFDETAPARRVADHYGTDHTTFEVNPDAAELLPEIVRHFDEPLADPAAIPTYMLSKEASNHVKVVLTGEGGDELFAGYEHYGIMTKGERYASRLPAMARRVLPKLAAATPGRLLDRLFPYASGLGQEGIRRFGQYLAHLDDPEGAYLDIVSIFDENERASLLQEADQVDEDIAHYFQNRDLLSGLLSVETAVQLPDNLLMKVDKMTMAAPIEARTPLLSEYVASFVQRLPNSFKRNDGVDKYIFRRAMRDVLPREIFEREKQRFFVPIHEWLHGPVGDFAWQKIENGVRRGHFDERYIERIRRKYDQSPIYYSRQIWCLLNFELWFEEFIEGHA